MKRQELDQLRQKSRAELAKDAAELRKQLVDMRLKKSQQMMGNVRQIGHTRRRLAVLQTLLGAKE